MPGPPSAVPGTAKCVGTFSPGTQHAGTAFGGTRYSKMCRYFCRRERNTPEIDANEVKQLLIASLTGRTVGFARSSEGDGCTRTRHRHLGRRGPCTTFSTGVPIRSAHCSAGPHTLGGVGRWLVLVCTAAVHPIKNGWFCRKGTRPEQKKKNWTSPHRKKKKLLQNEKKTLERERKTCLEGNEPRTWIL